MAGFFDMLWYFPAGCQVCFQKHAVSESCPIRRRGQVSLWFTQCWMYSLLNTITVRPFNHWLTGFDSKGIFKNILKGDLYPVKLKGGFTKGHVRCMGLRTWFQPHSLPQPPTRSETTVLMEVLTFQTNNEHPIITRHVILSAALTMLLFHCLWSGSEYRTPLNKQICLVLWTEHH